MGQFFICSFCNGFKTIFVINQESILFVRAIYIFISNIQVNDYMFLKWYYSIKYLLNVTTITIY